jgi:cytidyltransferase-like protein
MVEETYIAVSGGFDPLHVGHLRMINDASKLGKVIVLLNSDKWLKKKKKKVFMPFEQRKEIQRIRQNMLFVKRLGLKQSLGLEVI